MVLSLFVSVVTVGMFDALEEVDKKKRRAAQRARKEELERHGGDEHKANRAARRLLLSALADDQVSQCASCAGAGGEAWERAIPDDELVFRPDRGLMVTKISN